MYVVSLPCGSCKFPYTKNMIDLTKIKYNNMHWDVKTKPNKNYEGAATSCIWMLLKRGMENEEWGMGNGEWGMGNGEWGMGNEEWEIEMGNWIFFTLTLILIPLEQLHTSRDSIRKAREAFLMHRGNTLEPAGLNRRDEM